MGRAIREGSTADCSILVDIAAGCTEVDVIEDIERVHAELNQRSLVDGKVLLEREVRIEHMRTKDAVSAYVSDLIQTRRREGRSQRLCLEVDQTVAGEAGDLRLECAGVSVDLAWDAAGDLIAARAIAERKRQTAGVVQHGAELPSSDDLVG